MGSDQGLIRATACAILDLTAVERVLTTQGSPIFKDHIPARSDLLVGHLEANGAVIDAKPNAPKFGAGANTFNEAFGIARNPWDLSRSAAGSRGRRRGGTACLARGADLTPVEPRGMV